jgi:hypothetical protein
MIFGAAPRAKCRRCMSRSITDACAESIGEGDSCATRGRARPSVRNSENRGDSRELYLAANRE